MMTAEEARKESINEKQINEDEKERIEHDIAPLVERQVENNKRSEKKEYKIILPYTPSYFMKKILEEEYGYVVYGVYGKDKHSEENILTHYVLDFSVY